MQISLAERIDSSALTLVEDASVAMIIDESEQEIMYHAGEGIYASSRIVNSGKTFKCVVQIEGYSNISAMDTVPENTGISIRSYTNSARISPEGHHYPGMELEFIDNPATKDYYEIMIYKIGDDRISTMYPYNLNSEIILNEGFEPYSTRSIVFSDQLIRDSLVKMNLDFQGTTMVSCSGGDCYQIIREKKLFVELRHISREYYLFKKSVYFYENTRYADFIEGSVSAYPVYSNIENGLGILASYSASTDSVEVAGDTIRLFK